MGWDQRETLSRNLHGMVSDKHTQSRKKENQLEGGWGWVIGILSMSSDFGLAVDATYRLCSCFWLSESPGYLY